MARLGDRNYEKPVIFPIRNYHKDWNIKSIQIIKEEKKLTNTKRIKNFMKQKYKIEYLITVKIFHIIKYFKDFFSLIKL